MFTSLTRLIVVAMAFSLACGSASPVSTRSSDALPDDITVIQRIVQGTPVEPYLSVSVLLASTPNVRQAILKSLQQTSNLQQDAVLTLGAVNDAVRVVAPDIGHDFGLASARRDRESPERQRLSQEIKALVSGTAIDRQITYLSLSGYDVPVLQAMLDTLRSVNLNQDPVLTLEVIVARTATVGYDAAKLGDFGLEAAKTDRRVQQELASRPRVEVINVVIGTDSIGRPEFTVTMRNNGT